MNFDLIIYDIQMFVGIANDTFNDAYKIIHRVWYVETHPNNTLSQKSYM